MSTRLISQVKTLSLSADNKFYLIIQFNFTNSHVLHNSFADRGHCASLPSRQNSSRENLTMNFPQIVLNYCDLYISLMQYHWPWLNIYFVCPFREGNYAWISKLALACTPHCQNSNWNLCTFHSSRSEVTMSAVCSHRTTAAHSSNTCHFDLTHTHMQHKSYYFYVTASFLFNV